jgi:hypothetical protein
MRDFNPVEAIDEKDGIPGGGDFGQKGFCGCLLDAQGTRMGRPGSTEQPIGLQQQCRALRQHAFDQRAQSRRLPRARQAHDVHEPVRVHRGADFVEDCPARDDHPIDIGRDGRQSVVCLFLDAD